MADQPVLTVGITAYNSERYLEQCIRSVLDQTYQAVEVIVVDDRSTDATSEIAASFGDAITVITHEANSGSLVQGRIDVIEAARGDFVHHLDADDFLDREFARRMLEAFAEDPELDWVACNIRVVDRKGRYLKDWKYDHYPRDPFDALRNGWESASLCFPMKAVYRLDWIRESGLTWYRLPTTLMGEDVMTSIRYLSADPGLSVVDDHLINYRVHGDNLSGTVRERVKMIIDVKEYFIEHLSEGLYLRDPRLLRLDYRSDEYWALVHLLIAESYAKWIDIVDMPKIYYKAAKQKRPSRADLADDLALFREPIERHVALSEQFSDTYAGELRALVATLP